MKQRIRTAALLLVLAVTIAIPILSGTGGEAFKQPEEITAHADGAYDKLAIELAGATAFDDARNAIKSAEDPDTAQQQFETNLGLLTSGMHFGNVGIFVGPKGTSKNSDTWSVYRSKVTINNEQIQAYDAVTEDAFTKYKAFGGAVQKLNAKSQKSKGSSSSANKALDTVSAAGAKIMNLGVNLLSQYNPAPVLLALFDSSNLSTHSDNKLVQLINENDDLREPVKIMGGTTGFGVPFTVMLLGFVVVFLLAGSVTMTLINGRAAGEGIRKAMWKFIIGCIAVPLIAKGLDAGINFLKDMSVKQANSPESNYVEQNLNFADWYTCGFAVPAGTGVAIDKDGDFLFSPDAVRAINTYTYQTVWGVSNPTDKQMQEKMEEYFNMYKGSPMVIGFAEPMKVSADGVARNWNTKNFYATLANFGENKPLTEGMEIAEGVDRADVGNVGYYITNAIDMQKTDNGWKINGHESLGHGVSPIAATNMMRTSFTGSAMVVNTNSTMGSVAFNVSNSSEDNTRMTPMVRFLATFSMVMAAMKGLFSIFAAGFAGVLGGGAKTLTGSSSGVGQAIGGAIALVGGVFGISIIMTMTFVLLDQFYGVMLSLLNGIDGGADILDPFKEAVEDIPLLGWLLADVLTSVARLILTLMCALTLPKFGGIPVTLYCQYMAELPGRFAEKAQAMENKFTGDFRGGAGSHGNGVANAMKMAQNASNMSGKVDGMKAGLGVIGGALAGRALTKAGDTLADKYKGADTGEGAGSAENDVSGSMAVAEEEAVAAEEAMAMGAGGTGDDESTHRPEETPGQSGGVPAEGAGDKKDAAPDATRDGLGTTVSNAEAGETVNVDGNDMKEVEKEDVNDHTEGGTVAESDNEQLAINDNEVSEMADSDSMNSESSVSSEMSTGEEAVQSELLAEESSLSEQMGADETNLAENSAMATMNSSDDVRMESHSEHSSMAGGTESKAAGTSQMSGNSLGAATPGNAAAGQGRQTMAGSQKATGSASSGNSAGRKALTKEQKANRKMQAIAKGLQIAGGNTTTGQMAAGVLAGSAHVLGSAAGAGNVTGRGVNAVRNYKQRQNDIAAGLGGGYSRNRQAGNVSNTGGGNARPDVKPPISPPETARQNAIAAEAMAREAEYQDAMRDAQRNRMMEDEARRRDAARRGTR